MQQETFIIYGNIIIQHNFKRNYENIIMALEMALSIKAGIVILQKLFIGNQEISHNTFNHYWPQEKRSEIRLVTVIR